MSTFDLGDHSLSTSMPIQGDPGYPESRGSFEMDPPASVSAAQMWKQSLRPSSQGSSKLNTKGNKFIINYIGCFIIIYMQKFLKLAELQSVRCVFV